MYIKKNFYIYIFHTSNVTPLFDLKKVALDNSQFFHTSSLTPQTVKLVNGYGSQFGLLAAAMSWGHCLTSNQSGSGKTQAFFQYKYFEIVS